MDPDNPNPAPSGGAAPAAPAEPANPAPQPSGGEGNPPEPTDPAPQTPDPDMPDHGIDPDKGIDPDQGDEPTGNPPEDPLNSPDKTDNPDDPADKVEDENQSADLSKMSRTERAQYFQSLEAKTAKEVAAVVDATYQPESVDDLAQKYIDQGKTEFEAQMLAREEVRDQEKDIAKARADRAELNASLAIEATEVLATVEWLNPNNKGAFDKVSSEAATQLYDELCLQRDVNTAQRNDKGEPIPGTGQIIGATMTPKQFYGLVDKIRSSGMEGAEQKAQKNAEEQMAAVAAPSSNSNRSEPAFDQLSNEQKREKLRASGHLVT